MNKLQLFVMWLDGYIDGKTSLNEEQTKKLSDKLNNLFEHEADASKPRYEFLHEIKIQPHNSPFEENPSLGPPGNMTGPDGVKYRC